MNCCIFCRCRWVYCWSADMSEWTVFKHPW